MSPSSTYSNPLVMKSNYKRLGDYIRQVDVRNRDLAEDNLVGLTIEKAFIPSVANTIGTDLSNYKVISKGQFACSLMQVSRDGKMPVAMFKDERGIMSPAYPMFEVYRQDELMPEFLMLWFSRKEFDREVTFWAVGGVRGSLTWEDFENLNIPVPPIDEQRKIVVEYQAVERRIENNRRLIATLEDTAQTIYPKMFVDNIDPNNLPQGWRMGKLGEYGTVTTGKTPSSKCPEDYGEYVDFITPGEFNGCDIFYANPSRKLSEIGVQKLNSKILPPYSIAVTCIGSDMGKVRICKNRCISNQQINGIILNYPEFMPYLFFTLRSMKDELQRLAVGSSTMPMLSKSEFERIEIISPSDTTYSEFYKLTLPLIKFVALLERERDKFEEVKSLLLAKLSNI